MRDVDPPAGPFAHEPARERPDSPPPAYGVPKTGGSFVDWNDVVERLRSARAYWLATMSPASRPHAVPIWGVLVQGDLFLESGAETTRKSRNLAANPNVSVHLDGADDVIIVSGTAIPVRPAADLARELVAAFSTKYPGYAPSPTAWSESGLVRVEPDTVLAWHDMPTATRWRIKTRTPSVEIDAGRAGSAEGSA
jgi:nitroimidazol reductase NimA-like FMN-containing flavoprotein (pyridoxamine 5'-phosphate oxidase superfamily)